MKNLARLETLAGYQDGFMDASLWESYTREALRHYQGEELATLRAGKPGTYPTFLANDRVVIKFFGRLFDGGQSCQVEQEAARLLAGQEGIPTARLLGEGQLFEGGGGWEWPYLIFELLAGEDLGSASPALDDEESRSAAGWLGEVSGRIHALNIKGNPVFDDTWNTYFSFLNVQRLNCRARLGEWGSLPEHLLAQVEDYLLPVSELTAPGEQAHLIHGDLTRDHLLGKRVSGRWRATGLIDFGDAMSGSIYYELAALHMDGLSARSDLLRAFLDAYPLDLRADPLFARKALGTALLHRFNVFAGLPGLEGIGSLEELAERIWGDKN